jgi:hypothetical protein
MVTRDAKPGDDVVFKHYKNGHSSDFLERERERRERGSVDMDFGLIKIYVMRAK